MSYYNDIYKKRVNRFGNDYQSRLQGEREYAFELYLQRSVYTTDFTYNDVTYPCSFEPYKQDETQTLHYMLTRTSTSIPKGTILSFYDKDNNEQKWMVYWLEEIRATGYNRYIMLKMTHQISWVDRSNTKQTCWAYLYGQEDNMLKDELKSRSRSDVLYNENLKASFFVTSTNTKIRKEDYFTITIEDLNGGTVTEGYRVTGYDNISTPGVCFVTVDPTYLMDETAVPTKGSTDKDEDFFWLNSKEYHHEEES